MLLQGERRVEGVANEGGSPVLSERAPFDLNTDGIDARLACDKGLQEEGAEADRQFRAAAEAISGAVNVLDGQILRWEPWEAEKAVKVEHCPHCKGLVRVTYLHETELHGLGYEGRWVNMTCKQWKCPVCRKRKIRELARRLHEGPLVKRAIELREAGVLWCTKFLSLTPPGKEYRATHTPEETAYEMQKCWRLLLQCLRRKYGSFEFFWVMELQGDGYPHMHVLMVGKGIRPKGIQEFIRERWSGRYGMGFIDIRARRGKFNKRLRKWDVYNFGDARKAINYMLAYVEGGLEWIDDDKHVFGYSAGALGVLSAAEESGRHVVMVQVCKGQVMEDRDFKAVFDVHGGAALRAELPAFFDYSTEEDPETGMARLKYPIYSGRAAADVVARLTKKAGVGDAVPKCRSASRSRGIKSN